MPADAPQRMVDGQRGQRYGEVLALYLTDEGIQGQVYGTQLLNDALRSWWRSSTPTLSPRNLRL